MNSFTVLTGIFFFALLTVGLIGAYRSIRWWKADRDTGHSGAPFNRASRGRGAEFQRDTQAGRI